MTRTFSVLIILIVIGAALSSGADAASAQGSPWWQHAVIYEIYPRSFQDSDANGIGDLKGISQRLDYLQNLGVDAIWLTPFYPSPQVDFGYDISDYTTVDPQYGTLADFDRLMASAKAHHIRVIVDMVLNHTSDRHPWFIEAASSRQSPRHDWYVWNDGKRDASGKAIPPNNWVTYFGGSAWEWTPTLSQFYYHAYYKEQPDLNWRNPAVEKAMFDVMRFWLDRGVAGFRLDSIPDLFEDLRLRDEPAVGTEVPGQSHQPRLYTTNLPEIHRVIRRLRALVSKYPGDIVLIGETALPTTADLDRWYGTRHDELQLPMDTLVGFIDKLDAPQFRQRLYEMYTQLHGSEPLLLFDSHDSVRSWDRYGDGAHNLQIAKLIATLLLTSRATALIYQGQEIGQVTSDPVRIEDVKDPVGKTGWPEYKGRDGERTPMQWDASNRQAGFSSNSKTWLPVSANYQTVNVRVELSDPESLLRWYKTLITMRKSVPALWDGAAVMLDKKSRDVLSYARVARDGTAVVIALNMSPSSQRISLDLRATGIRGRQVRTLLASTASAGPAKDREIELPPFTAWIGSVH